ncbi:vegetative cell wall protein gp1-like [Iris pallida]|uniref:Vegetative cell wall protein gp1-like n=1 Tax=Iris pallida TaxID=29817 RepID=A0AAX6HBV1_IRIPA|nr:vegetative cell wall protein gp1-like [Iris pallida]
MSPSLPCTTRPRTSNHQSNRRVRCRGRTTPFLRPPASIQYNNQRVQPRVRPRASVSVYLYQSSSSNPLHQSTQGISCPTSGHDSVSKKFTQTLTDSRTPESPASAPAGRRSGSRRDRATGSPPTRVSHTASSYRIAASSRPRFAHVYVFSWRNPPQPREPPPLGWGAAARAEPPHHPRSGDHAASPRSSLLRAVRPLLASESVVSRSGHRARRLSLPTASDPRLPHTAALKRKQSTVSRAPTPPPDPPATEPLAARREVEPSAVHLVTTVLRRRPHVVSQLDLSGLNWIVGFSS